MNGEKPRAWIQTIGLFAIPIVVGFCSNSVAKSNATREVNARMVELAAQVLAGPANDSTRAIRLWAVSVLRRYSDVPLNAIVESSLVRHRSFTAQPNSFLVDSSGKIRGIAWFGTIPSVSCDSKGKCTAVQQ